MSPRSGTPVKLLGREDASVDWYNLEKSKRVKAFRCGEFDACIERAEALQGNPTRKREKYARREDAILHALELEKRQLEKKQQKLGISSNNVDNRTSDVVKRDMNSRSSEFYERRDYSRYTNHKTQAFSKRVPLSLEEDNTSNYKYLHKGRNSKQFGLKEVPSEAIPRTRGLQDFGLRIAPSKRKFSQHFTWESFQEPNDNIIDVLQSAGNSIRSVGHFGSSKNPLDVKRKRLHGSLLDDSPVRKRDRRRPLVQVLQSSAKVPTCNVQPNNDAGVIPMQDTKESMGVVCRGKRSRCIYLPADYPCDQTPGTANQLEMDDSFHEMSSLSEETEGTSSVLIEANDSDSSQMECSEHAIDGVDDFRSGSGRYSTSDSSAFPVQGKFGKVNDEEPFCSYEPQSHSQEQTACGYGGAGVSKWHMKGKRNIRNLAKRPMDGMDEKHSASVDKCNVSVKRTQNGSKGSMIKMGRTGFSGQMAAGLQFGKKNELFSYDVYDEDDFMDKDVSYRESFRSGNLRYPSTSKAARDQRISHSSFLDSEDDSHGLSSSGWEPDRSSYVARRAYWGYSSHQRNELVDVVLKVQVSYQGEREHVPLVSLMSRLNGKAIVGHPIQIEILEDGSTDLLAYRGEVSLDDSTATPPMWRTARRTAMQRIPRANPPPSALDGDDPELLQELDLESEPAFKKGHSSCYNHETRLPKKNVSQRKPVKRVSLSNQKIRTLSSLAPEQRHGGEYADTVCGLIETEGTVPQVTCVPVKVVFSRILESIGRPPTAVAHWVLVRDPS